MIGVSQEVAAHLPLALQLLLQDRQPDRVSEPDFVHGKKQEPHEWRDYSWAEPFHGYDAATPLLVLLIIFIAALPLTQKGVNIDLPLETLALATPPPSHVPSIVIKRSATRQLAGAVVTLR